MTALLSLLLFLQVTPAPAATAAPAIVASPEASPLASATPACKVHDREAHGTMMPIFSNAETGIGPNTQSGDAIGRTGGSARAAGTAEVQVLVKANGDVGGVRLFTSSGDRGMDQQAMSAAAQGTYTAAIRDCVPIASVITVSP